MRCAEVARLPVTGEQTGVVITSEMIRSYLETLSRRGRSRNTVQMYGAKLRAFYHYLPSDKRVGPDTLAAWRGSLLEAGYSPSTVNTHLSAVNGLLGCLGRRDLQLAGQLEPEPSIQPELTRAEYLRLLQAARTLEKERTYLLVKVFALMGIRLGELSRLTVEQVRAGRLRVLDNGNRQYLSIPDCLRRELLDYVRWQGLRTGPVFVTRNGKAMSRTQVTSEIQSLCRDARVEEAKGTPRCLRKLYLSTRSEIERNVRLLAEQAYERVLDTEQLAAGWMEESPPTSREHREESFQSRRKDEDMEPTHM